MAKIKLPKKPHDMVLLSRLIISSQAKKIEFEVIHISLKTDIPL